mmetsp:Transcript_48961/g.117956  ORF Transcript_48961/g.117956 Transcript_48961/m.117956 type:complete len:230 (-) Transcript_48961:36-725(-)
MLHDLDRVLLLHARMYRPDARLDSGAGRGPHARRRVAVCGDAQRSLPGVAPLPHRVGPRRGRCHLRRGRAHGVRCERHGGQVPTALRVHRLRQQPLHRRHHPRRPPQPHNLRAGDRPSTRLRRRPRHERGGPVGRGPQRHGRRRARAQQARPRQPTARGGRHGEHGSGGRRLKAVPDVGGSADGSGDSRSLSTRAGRESPLQRVESSERCRLCAPQAIGALERRVLVSF